MTKQAQHTPGPWNVQQHNEEVIYIEGNRPEDGDTRCIAEIKNTDDEAPHDARLIAAAPRMYDFIAIMACLVDFPEAKAIVAAVKGDAAAEGRDAD